MIALISRLFLSTRNQDEGRLLMNSASPLIPYNFCESHHFLESELLRLEYWIYISIFKSQKVVNSLQKVKIDTPRFYSLAVASRKQCLLAVVLIQISCFVPHILKSSFNAR